MIDSDIFLKLGFVAAKYDKLKALLEDDKFADKVAVKCNDSGHDPRWCMSCSRRMDGIDDYRREIAKAMGWENE